MSIDFHIKKKKIEILLFYLSNLLLFIKFNSFYLDIHVFCIREKCL